MQKNIIYTRAPVIIERLIFNSHFCMDIYAIKNKGGTVSNNIKYIIGNIRLYTARGG